VLEEAVGEGGFPVVNVRHDAEVAEAREGDGGDLGLEGGGYAWVGAALGGLKRGRGVEGAGGGCGGGCGGVSGGGRGCECAWGISR